MSNIVDDSIENKCYTKNIEMGLEGKSFKALLFGYGEQGREANE